MQVFNNIKGFLHVKLGMREFLIPINHIDGISDLIKSEKDNQLPEHIICTFVRNDDHIPVINLEKYLKCKNPSSSQSRIIFYYSSKAKKVLGVGFDEILAFYESKSLSKVKSKIIEIPERSDCFRNKYHARIDDRFIQVLELNKILDAFFEKPLRHL